MLSVVFVPILPNITIHRTVKKLSFLPPGDFQGLCRFVWKRRRWRGIEGTPMSRADEVRAKPNP